MLKAEIGFGVLRWRDRIGKNKFRPPIFKKHEKYMYPLLFYEKYKTALGTACTLVFRFIRNSRLAPVFETLLYAEDKLEGSQLKREKIVDFLFYPP